MSRGGGKQESKRGGRDGGREGGREGGPGNSSLREERQAGWMGQDDLAAVPRPIRENGGGVAGAYDRRGAGVSRMNSISLDVDGLIEQLLSVRGKREKEFERERSAAGGVDGTLKSAVTLSQEQWSMISFVQNQK